MNDEAQHLIAALELAPLPQEGGFFRRTWTSTVNNSRGRSAGSAIYFLLTTRDFSALHRLNGEELWLFHGGDAIEHVQLRADPAPTLVTRLGSAVLDGATSQMRVAGGVWQGARLSNSGNHGWALCSCVMVPAWDDAEFELGDRSRLQEEFPAASAWITLLTR